MKSLALYVHIPFCAGKCYYCDFLSFADVAEDIRLRYTEALLQEIAEAAATLPKQSAADFEVSSIYFGGGTPSFIAPVQIERILNHIRDHFHVRTGAEITLELNPGTVTYDSLKAYKSFGITRLAIGAQSMMNLDLEHLGRVHSVSDFYEAYRNARTAGFRNISVDVMMGLPGQKYADYLNTLREIVACKPEHISSYALTIEEGTPFHEIYGSGRTARDNALGLFRLDLPDEEEERKMYAETANFLVSAGYHRYEISNFAKNDEERPHRYESKHNIVYWTRGDYLGFGLGASSMIENTRFSNIRDLNAYIEADGDVQKIRENETVLDIRAQIEEFMFLGLRMMRGVSFARFEECFHLSMRELYGAVIDAMCRDGLMQEDEGSVMLTARGVDVSNTVMSHFLLEEEQKEEDAFTGGDEEKDQDREAKEDGPPQDKESEEKP